MGFFSNLLGKSNLIFIHTDKQQYYAGEVVTGQVILSAVAPLRVDGVFLKLSGRESTEMDIPRTRTVYYTTSSGATSSRTEKYVVRVSDSNTFLRRKYCLYAQKCTMAGGNFVFPFQFQLDSKLPGTYYMTKGSSWDGYVKASVSFQVEAEVAVPGILTPNLCHSQAILICEPLRDTLASSEVYQEQKVTFLCCVPKGVVSLSANIDKNAYCPGETVILRLVVDNSQSQVDLGACSLKLSESTTIRAGMDSKSLNRTIIKTKSLGVTKGERAERFIELQLPPQLEPSTSAHLVDCTYALDVVLKVPWSPDVVCRREVQIVAPQSPTYVTALEFPPNWNPTVYNTVDLNSVQYVSY